MSDAAHGTYRTKDEVEEYRKRDPIVLLKDYMIAEGSLDEQGYFELEKDVSAEVEDAVNFAEESPDPTPEALYSDVYAEEV
jgi:TPP-dependent pyruvate/acetoin dehydrogenase alpha subunit